MGKTDITHRRTNTAVVRRVHRSSLKSSYGDFSQQWMDQSRDLVIIAEIIVVVIILIVYRIDAIVVRIVILIVEIIFIRRFWLRWGHLFSLSFSVEYWKKLEWHWYLMYWIKEEGLANGSWKEESGIFFTSAYLVNISRLDNCLLSHSTKLP